MANNEKNMTTGNENIDDKKEQQGTPDVPANETDKTEKVGVFKKVGGFFKKNGKKIGVGIGIAAAFAGGIAAEKIGIPNFKKGTDPAGDPEE